MDRRRSKLAAIVAFLAISAMFSGPAMAQINATGRWSVTIETELGPIGPYVEEWVQTGDMLSSPPWSGTIDPVSGVFSETAPPPFPGICPRDTRSGIVSPDGRTFRAAGIGHVFTPGRCNEFAGLFSGTRLCGNGLVDAEEQCDDVNLDDGDGCSFTCGIEQCFACTGEPSTCEPAAGSACDDDNACTVDDTCNESGICSGVRPDNACVGDCNCDGVVTINELVLGVDIALSKASATQCAAFDSGDPGHVTIVELVRAALNVLYGCR